ncbi:MAG: hypothetical protein OXK80_00350 [Bdellovibrionales bacterium]|nr:hypothetical protein [Bdellovibrionales bacterium]
MSVQKILDLFGSEFNDRITFSKKRDNILFKNHKRELDSALQNSDLLEVLLNSKFGVNKHIQLINLSGIVREYKYEYESKDSFKILSIYEFFHDYVHEYIDTLGYPEIPFETFADVYYDGIHLLKILFKEKKLETYKEDKRVEALSQKSSVRRLALWELGYGSWKDEYWVELYLDKSIDQPKSPLYVLDLNPAFEEECIPFEEEHILEMIKEPLVRAPDKRFQVFVEHYKDTLSDDRLLSDILDSSWGLKKYNRLFRLSGIVNRVLVAQQYCNKTYVEKVHPSYEFLQEYIFNICADISMVSRLFKYDNLDPIGIELCNLFQKFIEENKQHEYKKDIRYKEFVKKCESYRRYVLQVVAPKKTVQEDRCKGCGRVV